MILNEAINESDLVSVTEDFAPGDFVCVELSLNTTVLGTVEQLEYDEMRIKTSSGKYLTFNAESKPSLSSVLKTITKPPNLYNLKPGVIISRVAVNKKGEWFREYAKVIRSECGRGISPYLIELEYLNKDVSGNENVSYMVKYKMPLEQQMKFWTIEE